MTWLSDITDDLWANKLAKGFNTTDVPLEFCLLTAEVGEAIDAWRRDPDSLPGELADVFLFLVSVARMVGVDLEQVTGKPTVVVARPGSIPLEFARLTAGLGKAIDAWLQSPEVLPARLADVFTALVWLARLLDVDLERAVVEKMAINVKRQYVRNAVTGQPVKVEAAA
jgi:NTP pyrophosphatase (non-canonical NTP hydrolase)